MVRRRKRLSHADLILGTPNLAAFWRLGERSGTVARDETGANPGTYVGSPTLGVLGAIRGDGNTAATFASAKHLTITGIDLTASDFTLYGWLNWPATTGVAQFLFGTLGVAGGITLRLGSDSKMALGCHGVSVATSASSTFPTAAWHQFAVTYAHNGAVKYYLDGAPVNTTGNYAPAFVGGVVTKDIAANNGSNLVGSLDESAVFLRALNAGEIRALYDAAIG